MYNSDKEDNCKAAPKTQKALLAALQITRHQAIKRYGSKNLTHSLIQEWELREKEASNSSLQVAKALADPLVSAVRLAIDECGNPDQPPIDFDALALVLSDCVINQINDHSIDSGVEFWSVSDQPYTFARTYKYKQPTVSFPGIPSGESLDSIKPPIKPPIKPTNANLSSQSVSKKNTDDNWGDILLDIGKYTAEWLLYTSLSHMEKKIEKEASKLINKASKKKASVRFRFKFF